MSGARWELTELVCALTEQYKKDGLGEEEITEQILRDLTTRKELTQDTMLVSSIKDIIQVHADSCIDDIAKYVHVEVESKFSDHISMEEEYSSSKKSKTFAYFNLDDIPDYEPLESVLIGLRLQPGNLATFQSGNLAALHRLSTWDLDDLVEHQQWSELCTLLQRYLIQQENISITELCLELHMKYLRKFQSFQAIPVLNNLLLYLHTYFHTEHFTSIPYQPSSSVEEELTPMLRTRLQVLVQILQFLATYHSTLHKKEFYRISINVLILLARGSIHNHTRMIQSLSSHFYSDLLFSKLFLKIPPLLLLHLFHKSSLLQLLLFTIHTEHDHNNVSYLISLEWYLSLLSQWSLNIHIPIPLLSLSKTNLVSNITYSQGMPLLGEITMEPIQFFSALNASQFTSNEACSIVTSLFLNISDRILLYSFNNNKITSNILVISQLLLNISAHMLDTNTYATLTNKHIDWLLKSSCNSTLITINTMYSIIFELFTSLVISCQNNPSDYIEKLACTLHTYCNVFMQFMKAFLLVKNSTTTTNDVFIVCKHPLVIAFESWRHFLPILHHFQRSNTSSSVQAITQTILEFCITQLRQASTTDGVIHTNDASIQTYMVECVSYICIYTDVQQDIQLEVTNLLFSELIQSHLHVSIALLCLFTSTMSSSLVPHFTSLHFTSLQCLNNTLLHFIQGLAIVHPDLACHLIVPNIDSFSILHTLSTYQYHTYTSDGLTLRLLKQVFSYALLNRVYVEQYKYWLLEQQQQQQGHVEPCVETVSADELQQEDEHTSFHVYMSQRLNPQECNTSRLGITLNDNNTSLHFVAVTLDTLEVWTNIRILDLRQLVSSSIYAPSLVYSPTHAQITGFAAFLLHNIYKVGMQYSITELTLENYLAAVSCIQAHILGGCNVELLYFVGYACLIVHPSCVEKLISSCNNKNINNDVNDSTFLHEIQVYAERIVRKYKHGIVFNYYLQKGYPVHMLLGMILRQFFADYLTPIDIAKLVALAVSKGDHMIATMAATIVIGVYHKLSAILPANLPPNVPDIDGETCIESQTESGFAHALHTCRLSVDYAEMKSIMQSLEP